MCTDNICIHEQHTKTCAGTVSTHKLCSAKNSLLLLTVVAADVDIFFPSLSVSCFSLNFCVFETDFFFIFLLVLQL